MTRRSSPRARAQEIYREMVAARARDQAKPVDGGPGSPLARGRARKITTPSLTEKARALYEHSAAPVAEIARLAGVTERTIYKYAAKGNWTPRYRWSAAGGRPRGASWRAPACVAPVKGAAGRFVRRAEKGKPFAVGLKAADPAAARRAAAACRRAVALARGAALRAAMERREEARLRALETMNLAMAELNRYRAARIKAGKKPALRDDDRVAQLLVRTVEIATAHVERLLP